MLLRLIGWLLTLPAALAAVLFAVANRHDVRLELWPLPWAVDLPVYLAVLGALAVGMAVGGLFPWLSGCKARLQLRAERRRARSLDQRLAQLTPTDIPPP